MLGRLGRKHQVIFVFLPGSLGKGRLSVLIYFFFPVNVSLITEADWPGVLAVQRSAYPGFLLESLMVLQDKQRLGPATCWCIRSDDGVLGYLLAHPWGGAVPCWGESGQMVAEFPDFLFLHDMAILPHMRGRGLADALLLAACGWAERAGLGCMQLVAVLDAAAYWGRQGFSPVVPQPVLPKDYGAGACLMMRKLSF